MLSQTCARRELAALSDGLGFFAGTSEGILFGTLPAIAGTRARLVGAPNCAPSLRSVAGLLLAPALQSGLRGTPPTSLLVHRVARRFGSRFRAAGRAQID